MAPAVPAPVAYGQARHCVIRKFHAVDECGSVVVNRIVKRGLSIKSWLDHSSTSFRRRSATESLGVRSVGTH